nr:MAG TPA: hypothetical protein [Caudoviricetes sp.]
MSKRRFKVFKRHLPEDWVVVTRWNGWPIRYDRFGSFRAAHDYIHERLYEEMETTGPRELLAGGIGKRYG